jgi:hypothetical protein
VAKLKVYPVHENCHVLRHPVDGKISDEGSLWEDDAFTARLMDTNEVTTDEARAHKFSKNKKHDHTRPPAHATRQPEVKIDDDSIVSDEL